MSEIDYDRAGRLTTLDDDGLGFARRRGRVRWPRGLSLAFLAASSLALWVLILAAIELAS